MLTSIYNWVSGFIYDSPIDLTPLVNEKYTKAHGRKDPDIKQQDGMNKVESICQHVCQKIFKVKFMKQRPEWLINPLTGRKLELDCYNAKKKIAIEYQGLQHYKWPNQYNQTKDEFNAAVKRDEFKRLMCRKRGILLIAIPYTVKNCNIEQYIRDEYKKYQDLYNDFVLL